MLEWLEMRLDVGDDKGLVYQYGIEALNSDGDALKQECCLARIAGAALNRRPTSVRKSIEHGAIAPLPRVSSAVDRKRKLLFVLLFVQMKQRDVTELLARADDLAVQNKSYQEVYAAMAQSLSEAWVDLNKQLDYRKMLLDQSINFHESALQVTRSLIYSLFHNTAAGLVCFGIAAVEDFWQIGTMQRSRMFLLKIEVKTYTNMTNRELCITNNRSTCDLALRFRSEFSEVTSK